MRQRAFASQGVRAIYTKEYISRLRDGLQSALSLWEMPDSAQISLMNVSENATFQVRDGDRRLAVRVHRSGYHTVDEIRSELAWISALRREGVVDTPAPVETTAGDPLGTISVGKEGRHVVAFEFMVGEEPRIENDLKDWFKKLGAISARLHQHVNSWQFPQGFTRKRWNVETMLGRHGFWGDWRTAVGLDTDGLAIISAAVDKIDARLSSYGQESDRYGLVHADLRLANLLVDGSRMGVIDFDDCGFCWYAYDFAAAISFHELDPSIPSLQRAWLEGYRTVADFSREDEEELPTFILLRRILLTVWLSTHSETPTGQELGSTFTEGTVGIAQCYLSSTK